jgi:hypothetical protein
VGLLGLVVEVWLSHGTTEMTFTMLLPSIAAVVGLVFLLKHFASAERATEWHHHSQRGKPVKRRWRAGEWQYRDLTPEEENQRVIDLSI